MVFVTVRTQMSLSKTWANLPVNAIQSTSDDQKSIFTPEVKPYRR